MPTTLHHPNATLNPEGFLNRSEFIPNEVVAQAPEIVGVVFVYDERVAIISVEAFSGGKPHEAPVILQNGNDIVLGQPIPRGEVGKFQVPHSRIAAVSADILKSVHDGPHGVRVLVVRNGGSESRNARAQRQQQAKRDDGPNLLAPIFHDADILAHCSDRSAGPLEFAKFKGLSSNNLRLIPIPPDDAYDCESRLGCQLSPTAQSVL